MSSFCLCHSCKWFANFIDLFIKLDLCLIDSPYFALFNVIDFSSYFYAFFPSVCFGFILLLFFWFLRWDLRLMIWNFSPFLMYALLFWLFFFFLFSFFLPSCELLDLNIFKITLQFSYSVLSLSFLVVVVGIVIEREIDRQIDT